MFQLGCEQGKTPAESYVQDMTKILPNMQCLLLGLTDLTLNQWGPKVNIAHYSGSILFKLTGEVCVNRCNRSEKIKQVDEICCCVLLTSTYLKKSLVHKVIALIQKKNISGAQSSWRKIV